ncbi:uncharacterized protein LOC127010336 [Eriocheir sinensis]|uniref:uncharacterized protein LOC127010336 n=1 Tax=Eriocheir sinensis TaxID=95602 RepID=UPI0021C829A5|nr:uncharacterized protein LOC127010336 [Eriocheir sinensis]
MKGCRRRWEFTEQSTVEERSHLARIMKRRQPGNVLLVVGRAARCRVGTHQELRLSVPNNMTLGQLCRTLRDRLEVSPAHSLVYYVGSTVAAPGTCLATLYRQHAHVDGFLYVTFSEEIALG